MAPGTQRVEVAVIGEGLRTAAPPRARADKVVPWHTKVGSVVKGLVKWIPRCSLAPALIIIAVLHSGQSGPAGQVARMMGSVADLVDGSSKAALSTMDAAGNLTTDLAVWTRDVVAMGTSHYHNLAAGVDIVNVTVKRRSATIVTATPAYFVKWLRTDVGRNLVALPFQAVEELVHAGSSLSWFLPSIRTERTVYDVRWQYAYFGLRAQYLPSGHTQFSWQWTEADYDVVWANPLWELFGYTPDAQTDEVSFAISALIRSTPVISLPENLTPAVTLPFTAAAIAHSRRVLTGLCVWFTGAPPNGGR